MPNRPSRVVSLTSLVLSGLLCAVSPAYAVLGGSPTPPPPGSTSTARVAVAHAASSGTAGTTATAPYTVTQATLASGTTVREYVSQAGVVFAIAWNGPQMPDLPTLLGNYFPQYVQGIKDARAQHPGRGPIAVEQTGLVVHSGGHMGSFSGQAWLPQALPAGVNPSDIQ